MRGRLTAATEQKGVSSLSADVWIIRDTCPTCGRGNDNDRDDLNVTYNLSTMLTRAGFVGWRNVLDKPAPKVGRHILAVLDRMARDPDRWRQMNPVNGWGDYDSCLQGRMRAWAERCRDASPQDTIGGWL